MSDHRNGYIEGITAAMFEGGVNVPVTLMRTSNELGLSHTETLLLLQIMTYKQAEANEFPTPEQLSRRIGMSAQEVGLLLQRLLKDGFLSIDEQMDPDTGIRSERYNWSGWLQKAAEQTVSTMKSPARVVEPDVSSGKPFGAAPDLFSLFEQEFGRPLSPMEFETISGWIDQDRYPEELIRFALKEAVFAGKLHFRYIDRILIEWSRNRVTNTDEARAHTQKFRGGKS
ncbi:DnaD domain protein [Paenibacillus abyssi]|uniref:DNA replication protein DnaD n=1 Tax=Paenibacillus abyssi TaxID=1340531 RepID=A0A917CHZ9_9BACL|nr:DnaD domain protein [Paenibacillus abyssi]GGF89151.1 DNA replication protein DnaD [Paenibacillus abyssi]